MNLADLKPTPVWDRYWYFAAERLRMLLRRQRGDLAPWTTDPILASHRFTNTFRVTDRVSQYLLRNVIYNPQLPDLPQEVLFRTLVFKIFNKIETWERLTHGLGSITWQSFRTEDYHRILQDARENGASVFSAAYIMANPPFGAATKHQNYLLLVEKCFRDGLAQRLLNSDSLSTLYNRLLEIPSFGPFLAFQYAIDLNYSSCFDFDENEFVVAGPGARDGISKCFENWERYPAEEIIKLVAETKEEERRRVGVEWPRWISRDLHLIDCQNVFCEISKYSRISHPSVTGMSGRTRIKQTYVGGQGVLFRSPTIVFPPKWQVTQTPYLETPI